MSKQFGAKCRVGQERFDLGGEEKSIGVFPPIEWLDAQMIAGDIDLVLSEINDNDGKHAVEAFEHAFETVAFVKIENDFGIGVRGEHITQGL